MRILVTGGGGFLGQVIIRKLIERGNAICSLQRSSTPELTALGVECFQGDIADADSVQRAAARCEVIYHVAAKAGVWGRYDDFYRANIVGTENVLAACR
jgi:nucleoside-diphosphate-sugar epimerase